MSIVAINLGNREFRLVCPSENHSELQALAGKLELEINKFKKANPSASFEMLLVMVALGLLDSRQKKVNLDGGALLKEANDNFEIVLSSILDELKLVAEKSERC